MSQHKVRRNKNGRIVLRNKPDEPKRETVEHVLRTDGRTLAEVYNEALRRNYRPEDAKFSNDYYTARLIWRGPESQESFDRKQEEYQAKMRDFMAWYEENQEEVDAEIERREKVKRTRKERAKARKIAELKNQIEALEQKLEKCERT